MAYSKLTWTTGTAITPDRLNEREEIVYRMQRLFPDYAMTQIAWYHNSRWGGRNLGNAVTDAQWKAIKNGTFDDMYVGDYLVINKITYRIAGFDLFLHTGDTETTAHHITIVPDQTLYNAQMNTTNTTDGAYWNSAMKQTNLADALTTVKAAFGEAHILTRRALLANAASNGVTTGWAWQSTQIDLMSEAQVYGHTAWGKGGYDSGTEISQFPLFRMAPALRFYRNMWYWLKDVASASWFANANDGGLATYSGASTTGGVRPFFSIIG